VDEAGVTHFAAEQVDARYQLFFRGANSTRPRDMPAKHPPAQLRMPSGAARCWRFLTLRPAYKRVKHHLRASASSRGWTTSCCRP
jgi:hypothetical protein